LPSTREPSALRVDAGEHAGVPVQLSGTYYPAADGLGAARPLLVCLPGGTYNHRYWDLEVEGHEGYSFAREFAGRGHDVVAFDVLGTGASSRPERADVSLADQGAAAAAAVDQLAGAVGHPGPYIGVGHSMGGYVVTYQQAAYRSYSAVAILGTTYQYVAPLGLPAELLTACATHEGRAIVLEQSLAAFADPYVQGDRQMLVSWFHLEDVPRTVVDTDTATTLTVVPRAAAAASALPGIGSDLAAVIDVPVFLCYGAVDVSPAPHAEPAFFPASRDVTLFVLAGAGHCHNMASSRGVLWDRLASWCETVC
jgi:pimeloyl-ACP methyl ester carboxylesterase